MSDIGELVSLLRDLADGGPGDLICIHRADLRAVLDDRARYAAERESQQKLAIREGLAKVAAEEEAKRLKDGIRAFLIGEYPHPRSYRPKRCPHDVEYYESCTACDENFLAALIVNKPCPEPTRYDAGECCGGACFVAEAILK